MTVVDPSSSEPAGSPSVADLERDSALLHASPVGILVVDGGGMITWANDAASDMTGYGLNDVVGTSMFDYLVDEAVQGIMESVGYVAANPDALMGPLLIGFRHADGELRVLEVLATNRFADPHIEGLVVAVRDVTTQARINQTLERHTANEDRGYVLRTLCTALLGLPVRARAALVTATDGEVLANVQLPDALLAPAPEGAPPRPWQEALATGEGVFPTSLDGYDDELREVTEAEGLTTLWAVPVPAPSRGGTDFAACVVVARTDPWEVTLNERINIDMVVRNAALVMEREFFLAQLERMATTDELTGLANRAHLLRDRRDEAEPGSPEAGDVLPDAVLYVDLDGFKTINDRFGHRAGDGVLRALADRIAAACRRGDEIGRIGGDEFVVLLWDAPNDDGDVTVTVAERIIEVAQQPVTVEGLRGSEEATLGASVGIARSADVAAVSIDDLVAAADQALYEAKSAGRGRWSSISP